MQRAQFMWMCVLLAMYSLYTSCAATRVLRWLRAAASAALHANPAAALRRRAPHRQVLQEIALKLLRVGVHHLVRVLAEDGHLRGARGRVSAARRTGRVSRRVRAAGARLPQVAFAGGVALEPVLVAALLLAHLARRGGDGGAHATVRRWRARAATDGPRQSASRAPGSTSAASAGPWTVGAGGAHAHVSASAATRRKSVPRRSTREPRALMRLATALGDMKSALPILFAAVAHRTESRLALDEPLFFALFVPARHSRARAPRPSPPSPAAAARQRPSRAAKKRVLFRAPGRRSKGTRRGCRLWHRPPAP